MDNLRHFFGLKKDPFPQDISVRDLYPLPALEPLKQRVSFAVQQKAVTVITGDVGAGKSTSLRYMAHQLRSSDYQIIILDRWTVQPDGTVSADTSDLWDRVFLLSGIIYG
jgi:type II secretory pathway predicted ATPase ExeA